MPRYFAFLRAINVGGHLVKMDELRRLFESLEFSNVETFIASGNVIFDSKSRNMKTLEQKIEKKLREALGYEVVTFVRTEAELAEIANYQPFHESEFKAPASLQVLFLDEAPDKQAEQKLLELRTEFDDLHVRGREVYWLCRNRQSESTISNLALQKALGKPGTVRGANTVKKMVAKYAASKE